jgi:pimeloyl-ACP methyl ester carboxylesterase
VSWGLRLLFRLALMRPWGARTWVRYQTGKLYPSSPPSDLADHSAKVLANLREPGRMTGFQGMSRTDHSAAASRLDGVRAPVLVVMGSADPDFRDPEAEGRWVAERLRGELVLVEGAGHYPQAEAPEQFLPPVLAFLARRSHGP